MRFIARAIVQGAKAILADEPVASLDPENRERALELIASMTAKGVAVLAVFHDIEAMERLATRIVRMENGRVAA